MKRDTRSLRVLRAERDITQSQLAKKLSISHTRYWQIENAEGLAPSEDERKAIAAALSVRVDDIAWPFVGAHAS